MHVFMNNYLLCVCVFLSCRTFSCQHGVNAYPDQGRKGCQWWLHPRGRCLHWKRHHSAGPYHCIKLTPTDCEVVLKLAMCFWVSFIKLSKKKKYMHNVILHTHRNAYIHVYVCIYIQYVCVIYTYICTPTHIYQYMCTKVKNKCYIILVNLVSLKLFVSVLCVAGRKGAYDTWRC